MHVRDISTVALSLGYVFWWLIENYLIFASEVGQSGAISVPGLARLNSTPGTRDPNSELAQVSAVANVRIEAAKAALKEGTLKPEDYFFKAWVEKN